jgi:hypothetical protein
MSGSPACGSSHFPGGGVGFPDDVDSGRKSIVWITHGVPLNVRLINGDVLDLTGPERNFGATLNRAGITMYAVDQGGPGSLPPTGSNGRSRVSEPGHAGRLSGPSRLLRNQRGPGEDQMKAPFEAAGANEFDAS